MKLGIFGGTFDPPHSGHLILAMECRWQLGLDRVLWVLTPTPPHKQGQPITPQESRLAMLQACIDHDPYFDLSTVDLDRQPPLYAVDTVQIVKAQNPQAEVGYLIGEDSLYDLPDWHNPAEFARACDFIGVMRRPAAQAGSPAPLSLPKLFARVPGLEAKLKFVEAPLLEISSSAIRRRATNGQPYRYYLPEAVFHYIERNRLYRPPANGPGT